MRDEANRPFLKSGALRKVSPLTSLARLGTLLVWMVTMTCLADDEAKLFAELSKTLAPDKALELARRGATAVPHLERGLETGGRLGQLCAWALAQHPQPGCAQALRPLLWRVDQVAGYWAAKALGQMPDAQNVKALATLLPDERLGFWELSAGGVGRLTDVFSRGQRTSVP